MKYIAFDVDTPNYADNRMSAAGVAAMNLGPFVGTYNNKELDLMSETTRSMNLFATLRRRPDAQAIVKGSAKYPALSGVVRFYQTRPGVLVCAEISGLPEAGKPCGNRFFAFHIHSGSQCTGDSADPFADALTHYSRRS